MTEEEKEKLSLWLTETIAAAVDAVNATSPKDADAKLMDKAFDSLMDGLKTSSSEYLDALERSGASYAEATQGMRKVVDKALVEIVEIERRSR